MRFMNRWIYLNFTLVLRLWNVIHWWFKFNFLRWKTLVLFLCTLSL
jgi:hypothetical protein